MRSFRRTLSDNDPTAENDYLNYNRSHICLNRILMRANWAMPRKFAHDSESPAEETNGAGQRATPRTSVCGSMLEPATARLVREILAGQLSPLDSCPQHPQDAIQHASGIAPGTPSPSSRRDGCRTSSKTTTPHRSLPSVHGSDFGVARATIRYASTLRYKRHKLHYLAIKDTSSIT